VWNFSNGVADIVRDAGAIDAATLEAAGKKLRHDIHTTLKQASYDYGRLQYNTVVSACMKMLNMLEENRNASPTVLREGTAILLRVLYPTCPHITWQLWSDLGFDKQYGDLLDAPWPEPDPAALEQDEIELVVQVNGKLRGHIRVPKSAAKEAIEKMALADEGVARHTEGKPIKKIIVVPGKLLNVVV
jgi:leucyl-tRNA synthetase